MHRVLISAVTAFAVAFTLADAYSCSYDGVSLANIPLTVPPLEMVQVLTYDHDANSTTYWQFSLCTLSFAEYPGCNALGGYVMAYNGNLDGCVAVFDNAVSNSWSFNYGGANALFGGTFTVPNDQIANVTLLCDPTATTLQPVGTVNVRQAQDDAFMWTYDIILKSSAVCPVPPPPLPPGPPNPSPPPPQSALIQIATFDGFYCAGRGTKSYITPGCAASGASGSVFSVCTSDGSTLQQLLFNNSTTCGGPPAMTETTTVNQCVNNPIVQPGSTQLLNCTAQF